MQPVERFDGLESEYDLFPISMPGHTPMGTITPSHSVGIDTISPEAAMGPQSCMMTPSRSLTGGSEVADSSSSSRSIPAKSPIPFFHQLRELSFDDMHALGMERHSQPPVGHYHMQQQQGPPSVDSYRVQRKTTFHEAQRKISELQRVQISALQRRRAIAPAAGNPKPNMDVVCRSTRKCDYPDCKKAFRRIEHLKRHKQT